MRRLVFLLAAALGLRCNGVPHSAAPDSGVVGAADAADAAGTADGSPSDAAGLSDAAPLSDAGVHRTLTATVVDTRFHVAEHFRASIEMQLSGEPFAQLLGYNLTGFDRTLAQTDQYTDPTTMVQRTDPLAYALAVESYEYSKQPMNNTSFESGAGLSLMFGPLLNPTATVGVAAYQLLVDRFQRFALASGSGGPPGRNLIVSPAPRLNPLNYYGWPGLWPVFAEFASFDPTITPMAGHVATCSPSGSTSFGYGGVSNPSAILIADYECDYNSLNLPHRDRQVEKVLRPEALGYATWKQGLWVINYWGTLHDAASPPNGIVAVTASVAALVGQPGNTIVGKYVDPSDPTGQRLLPGTAGAFLGDIPLEGWQGLLMMEEIDNKAALLLGSLLTADGVSLGGASSLRAADDYSFDQPLLYFPAAVAVVEVDTAPSLGHQTKYFPRPSAMSITDGTSRLEGLSGLIGGFAEAFAFTDGANPAVGGSLPFQVTFDGDPFPADNGAPDGENTLHDRALGVLKIALVDLDRLHFDPVAKVLVDTASVTRAGAGPGISRGRTVSTVELAEATLALRTAYRALGGALQLYSNDTPDTLGGPSALDASPLGGAPFSGRLAERLLALIQAEAEFLVSKLLDADGAVHNGYDLGADTADASPTTLEAESAAIRALLEAYLATSDQRFRSRALDVYADLGRRFWLDGARIYRTVAGEDALLRYTPLRHGLLQGALRQYYKLVASAPSRAAEGAELLQRIQRTNKLILNGWDDQNQDNAIQYPAECLGAGLQMGERALTGELGHFGDGHDRDHDCVFEISSVRRPAALAAELDLLLQ
jgi:hypothetical protein